MRQLFNWRNKNINKIGHIDLNRWDPPENIIFGFTNDEDHNETLKFITLYRKYSIYKSKLINEKPTFQSILKTIRYDLNIEFKLGEKHKINVSILPGIIEGISVWALFFKY